MRNEIRLGKSGNFSSGPRAVPYCWPTRLSTSETRRYGNDCSSANALFSAGVSKEMPTISAPASVNSGVRSRNPWPWIVQPGVAALGYHQRTTHLPCRSARETSLPSWSGRVNPGAGEPSLTIALFYPDSLSLDSLSLDSLSLDSRLPQTLCHHGPMHRTTSLFAAVLALFTIGAVGACGGGGGRTGASAAKPAKSAVPTGPPTATVEVKGLEFNPKDVRVRAGETVAWMFDDGAIVHNVALPGVKSPDEKGGTWAYAFAKAGTYAYTCTIHPFMKGTVTVS
jgi:plastocyanin